jgi:hypothetical protein
MPGEVSADSYRTLASALVGDRLDRVHNDGYWSSWPASIRTRAHRRRFASRDFYLLPEVGIQLNFAAWPKYVSVGGVRLHQGEIAACAADASLYCDRPRFLFPRLLRLILIRFRQQPAACKQHRENDCLLHESSSIAARIFSAIILMMSLDDAHLFLLAQIGSFSEEGGQL